MKRQKVERLSELGFDSSHSTVDRLSTLPDDVIEAILARLPIKHAVRTSVLSRRWRYEWCNISQLVFDKQSFPLREDQTQTDFENKLVKIVDQVLLLHRGPILSFELSAELESFVDIDRWILFLSRNGIKRLALETRTEESYKLHSRVFWCNELTSLNLFECIINLPDSFKGYMNLTVLDLHYVSFSSNALEVLISMCPLLKQLVLSHIDGCARLKICAPQLIDLVVEGEFDGLSLESCPLLAAASFNLDRYGFDQSVATDVFELPRLEKLEFVGFALLMWRSGQLRLKFPIICPLKDLTVQINFEDMQEISAFMCCCSSAPVLQEVRLMAELSYVKTNVQTLVDDFWEARKGLNCQFSSLEFVEVTGFSGIRSEMKFIEYVLANAPVLETLEISVHEGHMLKILKEVVQFRRSSAKARIQVFPIVSPN